MIAVYRVNYEAGLDLCTMALMLSMNCIPFNLLLVPHSASHQPDVVPIFPCPNQPENILMLFTLRSYLLFNCCVFHLDRR